MAAVLQLPGMDQGLLARLMGGGGAGNPVSGGEEVSPEAFAERLQEMFDELELSPDQLTPEMQAALAQLLNGGINLPETMVSQGPEGKPLPPFVALAQAILQAATAGKESGPLAGQQAIDKMLPGSTVAGEPLASAPGLAEGMSDFQGELFKASGLLPGQKLDSVLSEAGIRQQVLPAGAIANGVVPFTLPGGAQGVSISSQNLLSMPVSQSVSDPAWGAAIGERLVWMAKGDHQMAELKITPPNLGPLEIKLTINHDQASVSFVSHHALVRDALEAAIPRLREMLADQSLNLAQADVGAGQQHDPGRAGEGHAGSGQLGPEGSDAEADGPGLSGGDRDVEDGVGQRGLGLLDLFV